MTGSWRRRHAGAAYAIANGREGRAEEDGFREFLRSWLRAVFRLRDFSSAA